MNGSRWIVVGVLMLGIIGCKDKAEPAYADCVQLEAKNDVIAVEGACNRAIAADPNSTSGKAAAAKVKELAPAVEKVRAEQAKAAEEARHAAAQARAARLPILRAKADIEEDGEDWHLRRQLRRCTVPRLRSSRAPRVRELLAGDGELLLLPLTIGCSAADRVR